MDSTCCTSCHLVLHDPYIQCHGCPAPAASSSSTSSSAVLVCLECFAKGREFGRHRNTHSYSVVNRDFSLLEDRWTAQEEMQLLNLLVQRGHGNWDDIAKVLVNKTPRQCEVHFQKVYLENDGGQFDNDWKDNKEPNRRDRPVALICPTECPPRPEHGTQNHKDLAGYNAARADFDQELDNLAEHEIKTVDFDTMKRALFPRDVSNEEEDAADTVLDSRLAMAAVEVYINKMKRRARRKQVTREYGLLNKGRTRWQQTHYHNLTRAGTHYDQLLRLGPRLTSSCAMDSDYVLESVEHELRLRKQILRLQDYRAQGLTQFASTAVFCRLRRERDRALRELSTDTVSDWIQSGLCVMYVQDRATGRAIPTTTGPTRRAALPLDLVGMPGYDKLTQEERDLCSEIRVYPETFLDIRQILVAECEKMNGLRLADARPAVKIDVNKTRKLYDYFLAKNVIRKPASPNGS